MSANVEAGIRSALSGGALPEPRAVLSLDLGGTQIRAAAVLADGSVLHRISSSTPSSEGPEAVVRACIRSLEEVRRVFERSELGRSVGLAGVGISAPGPVDPFLGVVIDPPNLGAAFRDVRLAERVGAALGLPAFLDRDTQVAAMGEGAFGVAQGSRDYLYVTVSTGIGGAIVSGGQLLRGPDGGAGELGHLLVDRDGPACGCGATGHLEAISSGVAIARVARAAAERGASDHMARLVREAGPAFGARHVAAAEEAGDPVATSIMTDARDAFAAACVTLVDIFNPDLIVVGGSLARAQGERWLAPAREAVARFGFRLQARRARIVPSLLGDDVGLVGGLVLVTSRLAEAAR